MFKVCEIALCCVLFVLVHCDDAHSLQPELGAVFVRVIDVGAGLACVAQIPGQGNDVHYLIYDAGHWNTDTHVLEAVQEIVPTGESIDLMVLSHSDSDHLGAVDEICDNYTVERVIRTGLQRTTRTWNDANNAIRMEKQTEDCIDINLQFFEYPPGGTYKFGETFVTFVCGFGEPPDDWQPLNQSEERNASSIVIRVLYNNHSILFCGDAVGRHIGDSPNACIATEQFMVDMSPVIEIDSDVIIAPHHGADNASSTKFIEAVSPTFVIFSAGHAHEHPRHTTAVRYLNAGINISNIFRTDLGDNEGGQEWSHGTDSANGHARGEGDVDILIRQNGTLEVAYRNPL